MRISKMFGKTVREVPAEAETISHQLLLKAGLVNQLTAGVYSTLPMALRTINKIENIVRDEMNKAGGQELSMPVLQPVELWQKSGREGPFGETLFHLRDRRQHVLVLGPTHEEIITDLVSRFVQSYRDLPLRLYQIQTKLRDEPRPRGGLLRVREFTMKDLYSFDIDEEGLDESYQKMRQAYQNIFARCGLPALMVEADSGAIGGKDSHEFMLVAESGEDEIIVCDSCKCAANVEKATGNKGQVEIEKPLSLEPVATPGMKSIEEVSQFLKVNPDRTLKVVLYAADGELVMAVIRGDLEINEIKLKKALHATDLRLASEAEIKEAGIVAGYVSPVGLNTKVRVAADDSVIEGVNYVAGGNQADSHLKNVNYPRDFRADILQDIAKARAGQVCSRCDCVLSATRGIEVGHIFKLGTFLSEKLNARFIDDKGVSRPIIMGCYGIGIGRLMAAAIEQNHDDKGIIWPLPIAPYQVHLCGLFMDKPGVPPVADRLYEEMQALGLEVLYDDRVESPGVKFNDADLMGMPFRITLSPRTLEGNNVEFKRRTDKKAQILPLAGIAEFIKELVEKEIDR